jgi:thioredoxin reductase
MSLPSLPIVVIGAGPVGLSAAAHVISRSLTPLVFEAGARIGEGVQRWGHVRVFSPWSLNVDPVVADLLTRRGWTMPAADEYPTGRELIEQYLEPLAALPELSPHIRLRTRVQSVARLHHDRMEDSGRQDAPFLVRVVGPDGEQDTLARAVIDASGTIDRPGFLGASGVRAIGEEAARAHIFYGIPDVLGTERARYSGRRVLVAGSGHSALNALLDLAELAEREPVTRITWAIRRQTIGHLLGGPRKDQLEERGKLGASVRRLLETRRVELVTGFHVTRVSMTPQGIVVSGGDRTLAAVDEIVAATGFRPDWSILSECRLDLDPAVESPRALAPLIDPNVHSCGTVLPHGAEELKQPDADLFVVGMKSYGRAPTFLMRTGYEQARSVVAAIAGDWDAARRVELVLPETGVCSTDRSSDAVRSCCGTTADSLAEMPVASVTLSRPSASDTALKAPSSTCCDSVLLSTSCGEETQPTCCGPERAPSVCGCGDAETSEPPAIESR